MTEGYRRINPITDKNFKRGDWNEAKTKRFWSYRIHIKKDGYFTEKWFQMEKFDQQHSATKKKSKVLTEKNKSKLIPKRINPNTGNYFKTGDTREDGFRFLRYAPEGSQKNGYMSEIYASPKGWINTKIRNTFGKIKIRCAEKNLPLEITTGYLISIFPKDSLCPALGIKMNFGGDTRMDSPSVDRLIPELGYVPKNVVWVCQEANILKSDRTSSELRAIADWIEQQPIYQRYNQ